MGLPTYATREQLMTATDFKTPAYLSSTIDRALQAASRQIERTMHRHFYPRTQTLVYRPRWASEWGSDATGSYVWLREDLLSISAITADGTVLTTDDWDLDGQDGDAFTILRVSGAVFSITGVWGYSNQTAPAGALAEALDASETDVDVTDSSLAGVGDLLTVGTEQMIVTEKSLLDTTANLDGALVADDSETSVPVNTGSLVKAGEVITVDSERMKVLEIASNNLIVKRAFDGSTLAAHDTASDVYAPRTLTVERGAVGSTATTHLTAAPITRNVPPAPITALCIAEALTQIEQESSGYGRVVGSGEGQREAVGKGLEDVRAQAAYYQKFRMAAV